jgi:DNA-binding NtrC family response regulator
MTMSASCDSRGASALIGQSTPINSLRRKIENLADASVPVVITGESGTGKELIARCLHAQANLQGSFVVVDCSTVFEARIYGAAFEARTGEHSDFFDSKWRDAEGGTLFLKHVERLSSRAQAKLSRMLQKADCKVDVSQPVIRIVASASEDLRKLCDRGVFLPELCYLLSVVHLESVPLREMLEDVPLLLEAFLAEAAHRYRRDIPAFDGVMPYALSHTWPGNGRELRNFALRLVLGLNEDGSAYERAVSPPSLAQLMNRFEKQIIVQQLRRHRGSIAAASEVLAIPKTTLYAKLQKHGISATVFRCGEPDGRGRGGPGLSKTGMTQDDLPDHKLEWAGQP